MYLPYNCTLWGGVEREQGESFPSRQTERKKKQEKNMSDNLALVFYQLIQLCCYEGGNGGAPGSGGA